MPEDHYVPRELAAVDLSDCPFDCLRIPLDDHHFCDGSIVSDRQGLDALRDDLRKTSVELSHLLDRLCSGRKGSLWSSVAKAGSFAVFPVIHILNEMLEPEKPLGYRPNGDPELLLRRLWRVCGDLLSLEVGLSHREESIVIGAARHALFAASYLPARLVAARSTNPVLDGDACSAVEAAERLLQEAQADG